MAKATKNVTPQHNTDYAEATTTDIPKSEAVVLTPELDHTVSAVAKKGGKVVAASEDKVKLKHKIKGNIVAMSIDAELAKKVVRDNPNIEIA